MFAVSDRWKKAIRSSHTVVSYVDVYPWQPGAAPFYGVKVLSGGVTVDSTSSVRRTLDCVLAQDTAGRLIPSTVFSPTAPYGSWARPFRGIQYPDGTVEVMPLGWFRITQAENDDAGAGPGIHLTGSDKSEPVSANIFTDPYVIGAGQNYATAIATLADNRHPGDVQTIMATDQITPLIVIDVGEDPWQHLTDMANSFGGECFYDQIGGFVLRLQPDPTVDLVTATYAAGEDLATLSMSDGAGVTLGAAAVLLETDHILSTQPGYNGVVMTAESTTLPAPLRTVLFDVDPTSPTYSLGPYGKRPSVQSSPYITSQQSCDAAARAFLIKNIGGTEPVTFAIIPDPALDADDVARVVRTSSGLDITGVIQSMTIPLTISERQDITLRPRQSLVVA